MIQLLVSAQKSLLHNVLGILFIPGHSIGKPKYTATVPFDEHTESIPVARLRSNNDGAVAFFHLAFRLE